MNTVKDVGMFIPYYIGQEIYEVEDITDWKGHRDVRFHTYEASMITVKKDKSIKIRFSITSDKSGRQVTLTREQLDMDRKPHVQGKFSHWYKYFSNKMEAQSVYEKLVNQISSSDVV